MFDWGAGGLGGCFVLNWPERMHVDCGQLVLVAAGCVPVPRRRVMKIVCLPVDGQTSAGCAVWLLHTAGTFNQRGLTPSPPPCFDLCSLVQALCYNVICSCTLKTEHTATTQHVHSKENKADTQNPRSWAAD